VGTLTNDKMLEYCGHQSSTLFIVPTYNRSLVKNLQPLNIYFGYPGSIG